MSESASPRQSERDVVAAVLTPGQQEAVNFYRALNVEGQWFVGVPDAAGGVEVIFIGDRFVWSLILNADGTDISASESVLYGGFLPGIDV